MKKLYTLLCCTALVLFISKGAIAQTTIDFESATVGSYTESPSTATMTETYSGYRFTANGSQIGMYSGIDRDNPSTYATSIGYNTNYFYMGMLIGGEINSFVITRQNGGLFDFTSIDLAPYLASPFTYDAPFDIYIQSFKSGTAVSTKLSKTTMVKGQGAYVPKVTFDESANADFKGIDKIVITTSAPSDFYALDNFKATSITTAPVHLKSFSGIFQQANKLLISWVSGVENNLAYYELPQSKDATHFTALLKTNAEGSGAQYDASVLQVENAMYYRLKMVDKDGAIAYSNILKLVNNLSQQIRLYPNPATDFLNIESKKAATIQLYNSIGTLVQRTVLQKGKNSIDVRQLPAGVYYIMINDQKRSFIKK